MFRFNSIVHCFKLIIPYYNIQKKATKRFHDKGITKTSINVNVYREKNRRVSRFLVHFQFWMKDDGERDEMVFFCFIFVKSVLAC